MYVYIYIYIHCIYIYIYIYICVWAGAVGEAAVGGGQRWSAADDGGGRQGRVASRRDRGYLDISTDSCRIHIHNLIPFSLK